MVSIVGMNKECFLQMLPYLAAQKHAGMYSESAGIFALKPEITVLLKSPIVRTDGLDSASIVDIKISVCLDYYSMKDSRSYAALRNPSTWVFASSLLSTCPLRDCVIRMSILDGTFGFTIF